jgi:hypothetical protein
MKGIFMEHALFGVNLLLILLVWRFMIRKTILDHARDKLFDLRDAVRAKYLTERWDMDSATYRKLRDLINGHLRFTEDYSIWKLVFIKIEVESNRDLHIDLQDKLKKVFLTVEPEQREFVKKVRSQAMGTVVEFAVFSSGFLLFLTTLITPFVVIFKFCNVVGRGFDVASRVAVRTAHNSGLFAGAMIAAAAQLIADKLMSPDWVEGYSYRMGTSASR